MTQQKLTHAERQRLVEVAYRDAPVINIQLGSASLILHEHC